MLCFWNMKRKRLSNFYKAIFFQLLVYNNYDSNGHFVYLHAWLYKLIVGSSGTVRPTRTRVHSTRTKVNSRPTPVRVLIICVAIDCIHLLQN